MISRSESGQNLSHGENTYVSQSQAIQNIADHLKDAGLESVRERSFRDYVSYLERAEDSRVKKHHRVAPRPLIEIEMDMQENSKNPEYLIEHNLAVELIGTLTRAIYYNEDGTLHKAAIIDEHQRYRMGKPSKRVEIANKLLNRTYFVV